MPVIIEEEITITENDVSQTTPPTQTNTRTNRQTILNRIDKFIGTASAEEVSHLAHSLENRSETLGIPPAQSRPKTTDRMLARLAAELVPILLTIFVVFPLVMWLVLNIMGSPFFGNITAGCPSSCQADALLLWSVVSGVGFLLIILAYYSLRKLMLRARS